VTTRQQRTSNNKQAIAKQYSNKEEEGRLPGQQNGHKQQEEIRQQHVTRSQLIN
jgi:hypothetical protein